MGSNRQRYKTGLFLPAVIIPSALVFFISISENKAVSLLISAAFGLLLGIGLYLNIIKEKQRFKKAYVIAAAVLRCLVCCDCSVGFYQTWMLSVNSMGSLVTAFSGIIYTAFV